MKVTPAVRVVRLGDFSLPDVREDLRALKSDAVCVFDVDQTCWPIPQPDYRIGNLVEEYSFSALGEILRDYRVRQGLSAEHVVIGIVNGKIEKNYFGWCSREDKFSVVSVCDVEEVIAPASIKQYVVGEVARHAVALVEGHWWHVDPRRCLYDFCGDKRDLAGRLFDGALCDACRSSLTPSAQEVLRRSAADCQAGNDGGRMPMEKVLFVAADPSKMTHLRIQKEIRDLKAELERSAQRSAFSLDVCLSARPSDVSRSLLAQPRAGFLHFSGHGRSDGAICLEDDSGQVQAVPATALAQLLRPVASLLRCVVLNACYSRVQADAILMIVPHVVGMVDAIGDTAAIAYSVGFYQAVFSGEPITVAHELGCAQVHMAAPGEQLTPELLTAKRNGVAP